MAWDSDPLNISSAVDKAQGKDLFEPDGNEDFAPTTRELPLRFDIRVKVNITEPPFVSDEVIRAHLESYLLKAVVASKYLQMSTIRVKAHTDTT